ncbi:PQQ-dependent dehydrogenase, methanol/ethanol family [Henriciella litoralis]|uniref:PQQ-dependent dehydrogenase, methanol/ethanol family n=1 Tax=Henriciella litoralis TaxID=568102 RepID=UPI000A040ABC|nr:PQQ-dependent dehydrogenase, methanol/ethanol family [Henriciella litoralis]
MRFFAASIVVLLSCGSLAACDRAGSSTGAGGTSSDDTRTIGSADLKAAGDNTAEWLSYGRTWSEQRFSPADSINRENVSELGLAWSADFSTARGQEATPLVIDGRIYTSTSWSNVEAYDAKTGAPVWSFDAEVPGATGAKACCDVVNRGLAAWGDKLYLGTLDGRLVALDRESGEPVWTAETVDGDGPYTITGAPRVVDGLVIIGNGGADMGAVRGYVSAYDAETGDLVWRFHTVPDNPANGPQPDYLEAAADTWTGDWWELGGGGTVWDAMAYDPELGLLYIGVGNGAPWNQQFRSPEGGDNLYLSSIVAIEAKSGDYVWHFQTTPGETWDYTATQHIMLADLEIDGETRKVLMQAPKNGFFYVLDRETGAFISADNYTKVTWALGIDPETGRPIENPAARYKSGPALVYPSALGGHNWHPMAFNPDEGLVYIPAQNAPQPYSSPDEWAPTPLGWNNAVGSSVASTGSSAGESKVFQKAAAPADAAPDPAPDNMQPVKERKIGVAALLAWDPVTQTEKWRVDYPGIWNGGLLSTAGGLVFQGTASGEFRAYDAATGDQLWSYPIQTGAIAAPMTYEIDGEQYVAIVTGWGGVYGLLSGVVQNHSRLLVFKLNGEATLPEPTETARVLDPPVMEVDPAKVARGGQLYGRYCVVCHAGGSAITDLRYSAAIDSEAGWMSVVKDGALESRGMVSFSPVMNDEDLASIRHFIVARAQAEAAKSAP